MVESITAGHPELVRGKVDAMVALLAEILAYGNQTGEFDVSDVVKTARTVHAAQVVLEVPIFTNLYPLEYFEDMARQLARLLVDGVCRIAP